MHRTIFLIVALLLSGAAAGRTHPSRQTAERAAALVGANDYNALAQLTPAEYDALPPLLQHFTDAIAGSYFNDLPKSCEAIAALLNDYSAKLDGPTQSRLYGMLLGNLRMMGEYGQAAELASRLLSGVADGDDTSRTTLEGMVRWFGALSQYPKTRLARPEGEITLPLHLVREEIRDALGNPKTIETLFAEVQIGDTTERFIFDTGCSQASFVSEEFAARHGIRIVCDSILVGGAAVNSYAKAGVLDSMRIGPITVYNPTFLITPPVEAVDTLYKITAVLGTDFMNLAGEMQLYPSEGRLVLPAAESPMPQTGHNLSLETASGGYTIRMTCDDEVVTMKFDTGAVKTSMGNNWFETHKTRVLAEGVQKEIGIGGFGGTSRGTGYKMPTLLFGIGPEQCSLPDIDVHSNVKSAMSSENVDGWLGIDFFLQFDKVTIDLRRMFVTVEH